MKKSEAIRKIFFALVEKFPNIPLDEVDEISKIALQAAEDCGMLPPEEKVYTFIVAGNTEITDYTCEWEDED